MDLRVKRKTIATITYLSRKPFNEDTCMYDIKGMVSDYVLRRFYYLRVGILKNSNFRTKTDIYNGMLVGYVMRQVLKIILAFNKQYIECFSRTYQSR